MYELTLNKQAIDALRTNVFPGSEFSTDGLKKVGEDTYSIVVNDEVLEALFSVALEGESPSDTITRCATLNLTNGKCN